MPCGRLHSRPVSTTPTLTRKGKCVYQSLAQRTGNQLPKQTKVCVLLVAIFTSLHALSLALNVSTFLSLQHKGIICIQGDVARTIEAATPNGEVDCLCIHAD